MEKLLKLVTFKESFIEGHVAHNTVQQDAVIKCCD
jgi:hypothetical protein